MIEFKNVSKVYDNGSVALDDVCLTINDGEFVLICGHSGAGKSTLFKLLTLKLYQTLVLSLLMTLMLRV